MSVLPQQQTFAPLAKASVAIDGSKFRAVNLRDNNFTKGSTVEPALERECQRNIELVWFTGENVPMVISY